MGKTRIHSCVDTTIAHYSPLLYKAVFTELQSP